MRVFGIGLHKTGTSTLQECFHILGYNVCPEQAGYRVRNEVANKEYLPALLVAHAFEAFADSPWNFCTMYRVLNEVFPDSKFILTHRRAERWYDSVLRWVERHKSGGLVDMRATLGCEVKRANRRRVIKAYNAYNTAVDQYFAKQGTRKLLVVNWEQGDGWDKLCGFLGRPTPRGQGGVGVLKLPHMLAYHAPTDSYVNKRPRRFQ